jgi:EAL domain-containing protein (putative c-di-GMP-specific phosphodiesterase class I)
MSNVQLDVNKIVESLVNQISQQAQRIAVLEATIDAIQKSNSKEVTE